LTILQQHYPYVPINQVKGREKEGKQRSYKRKDITNLGSSGGFCCWLGFTGGRRVILYPSGASFPSLREEYCHKSSWNESVGAGGSWWSHNPPLQSWPSASCKRLISSPMWHLRGREVGFAR